MILISKSIPTININNINPTWLKNWRLINDDTGNRKAEKLGKNKPKTEGPRIIPAIISPITVGCPNLLKMIPNNLANSTIVISCNTNTLKGFCRFPLKEFKKTVKKL